MLRCHQCGTLISTYDAQAAARIAGDGNEALCPSCAVAVYYAQQDEQHNEENQLAKARGDAVN